MKRDCSGSDRQFSLHLATNDAASGTLAMFEAPVDPPSTGKDYNEALFHTARAKRELMNAGHRKDGGGAIKANPKLTACKGVRS